MEPDNCDSQVSAATVTWAIETGVLDVIRRWQPVAISDVSHRAHLSEDVVRAAVDILQAADLIAVDASTQLLIADTNEVGSCPR